MKEPEVLKRAGQSPLENVYRTPEFKRASAKWWLDELAVQVQHSGNDRIVAICARSYIRARADVQKLP